MARRATCEHGCSTACSRKRQASRTLRRQREDLAPVELQRFVGTEGQSNKNSAPGRLLLALPIRSPVPGKCQRAVILASKTKPHRIGMHPFQRLSQLARFRGFGLQSTRKLPG